MDKIFSAKKENKNADTTAWEQEIDGLVYRLYELCEEEIKIISNYLPEQLSKEEIEKEIDRIFDLVKPESKKDMGKIMKEISPKLKNRADMGEVNKIIKEKLSQI